MAYPTNIITDLTKRFSLNTQQQVELTTLFSTDGVQELISTNQLVPIDLLYFHEPTQTLLMLPDDKLMQLLSVYKAVEKVLNFALSQIIVWLDINESLPFPYIFSEDNVITLLTQQDQIPVFRQYLMDHPKTVQHWERIKQVMTELRLLPTSQVRQKKMRAVDINASLLRDPLFSFIKGSLILTSEQLNISQVLFQYQNVAPAAIEKAATEYFKQLFVLNGKRITNIEFTAKQAGDQLGRIMTIAYLDSLNIAHKITYYIKTHQYGSKSNASRLGAPDPKELLVYKVLEFTGYGPKVHFLLNHMSQGGLYIASQDASFSNDPDKDKQFTVYDSLKETYNQHDPSIVSLEAQKAFSRLDIFARIFHLTDVATNPGNFGQVIIYHESQTREKWKLIDFRVETKDAYSYHNIMEGFISGNGMFNYIGTMGKLLRDRPLCERVTIARLVMQELASGRPRRDGITRKMPLKLAIRNAHSNIITFIQNNAMLLQLEASDNTTRDLDRYVEGIIQSYEQLAQGIRLSNEPNIIVV